MPSTVKTALLQIRLDRPVQDNLDVIAAGVEEAASAGARIVLLPELCLWPYFCQTEDETRFDLALTPASKAWAELQELAHRYGIHLMSPLFEKRAAGIYHNSVLHFTPAGTCGGCYRKTHIPDDPGYYEKFYFTPGDTTSPPFACDALNLSPLICWDQWFPEAARLATLGGAHILYYPTAIGWLPGEEAGEGQTHREAWMTMQRSHAIANGVFVASVNRVGFEPSPEGTGGTTFWGGSFVCDPMGTIIAQASADEEAMLLCDIEPANIESTRRTWPFLRDRRIDLYAPLTRRWIDE